MRLVESEEAVETTDALAARLGQVVHEAARARRVALLEVVVDPGQQRGQLVRVRVRVRVRARVRVRVRIRVTVTVTVRVKL